MYTAGCISVTELEHVCVHTGPKANWAWEWGCTACQAHPLHFVSDGKQMGRKGVLHWMGTQAKGHPSLKRPWVTSRAEGIFALAVLTALAFKHQPCGPLGCD